MQYRNNTTRRSRALTLLEMVIAVSAMTVVLMTLLPALVGIRNSWDARQGDAEITQNARVLVDHFGRHLSTAARITDVSAPSEEQGYIEFTDNDGNTCRYAVGGDGLVEFGPPDGGADLAGPVSRFQLACYDGNDFVTPTVEPGLVQFVTLTVTFPNAFHLGKEKKLSCSAHIRSAAVIGTDQLDRSRRIHVDSDSDFVSQDG